MFGTINQSIIVFCKQTQTTEIWWCIAQHWLPAPVIAFHGRDDGSLVVFSATGWWLNNENRDEE